MFLSCDDSGGSDDAADTTNDDVNDAASLGDSLTLSGTIDQIFVTSTKTLTAGYSNSSNADFRLYDESDGSVIYDTDSDGNEDLAFDYDGITPAPVVYSFSGWTGISSSNANAEGTTAVIDIDGTSDDIVFGNFENLPAEWDYYMYSTAETILDGTYIDTDDDPDTNHIYDNIRVFEGWNRMRIMTSDGETYTYTSGDVTDGHWTYMDNTN